MSTSAKPSSQDGRLAEIFGGTITELYERAAVTPGAAALTRALELRSFLALAEEQVAWVRDRVHEAMAPGRAMDELSADELAVRRAVAGCRARCPRRLPCRAR